MLTRITNFADAYALVPGWQDDARPRRVIAPLQHIFDPVISAADFYGQAEQWGDLPVRVGGFSVAPRIVFDCMPVLPANLAEAMLYHLQLRLIGGALLSATPSPPCRSATRVLTGRLHFCRRD